MTPTPRHQLHKGTYSGRHLNFMRDVRDHVAATRPESALRILSFGCSQGDECVDLAAVFPQAHVFGAEIDLPTLEIARRHNGANITIFESTVENLAASAPYDVIFAMNVLCLSPATRYLDNIAALYPFALFDEMVTLLDSLLKPGGFLVAYNAQYFLEDTARGAAYRAMAQPSCTGSGWIEKCNPNGDRVCRTVFRHEGREYGWAAWEAFSRADPGIDRVKHGRYEQHWIAGRERPGLKTANAIWRKP